MRELCGCWWLKTWGVVGEGEDIVCGAMKGLPMSFSHFLQVYQSFHLFFSLSVFFIQFLVFILFS